MKKEITLLLPDESDTLYFEHWKKDLFASACDIYMRLIPPSIILGESYSTFSDIDIPPFFTLSDEIIHPEIGTIIEIEEKDEAEKIKRKLKIEYPYCGFFLTPSHVCGIKIEKKQIKIRYIAKAELDDNSFIIIQKKKLSRDREKKAGS
ncbi:MAG TPA: hypothetical protein IAB12_05200 [Candidatus Ornithospirochaeta avicola]|uniref:Uncharacterized protein n=1 Tax=Candidatus Ornithospirochaeta avicola TaxID=2840896 RepID=A0A9D1PTC0_9SPIO|nr:hypothetical protein [Candidatus Ornithospirochaeta avicola]